MLSFDKLDFFDDESDDDGSGSVSLGTYNFQFCSVDSVGRVNGVGSGFFVMNGIKSIGYVIPSVVFVPRGVESKVGRLIELFWHP